MSNRILVVDDDSNILRMISFALEGDGFDVITADNGTTALQKVKEEHPELVILDVMMPDMSGIEVCEQLRKDSPTADLPIILLSAKAQVKDRIAGLKVGADEYLAKPVDLDELTVHVRKLLSRVQRYEKQAAGPEPAIQAPILPIKFRRLIAVLSPGGGNGGSTVAVNLAVLAAKENKGDVALLDLALQSGDLASLLDLKPAYNMADLARNLKRMDERMLESVFLKHSSGLFLLAAPPRIADTSAITPDSIARTLALTHERFTDVFVDLGNTVRDEQLLVLRDADLILLVLRLDFTCLRNARRVLEFLTELGIQKQRFHLVINRYGRPKEVPWAMAEKALLKETGLLKTAIHYLREDGRTINQANNNGVPVVLESPRSKIAKEIIKLAAVLAKTPA